VLMTAKLTMEFPGGNSHNFAHLQNHLALPKTSFPTKISATDNNNHYPD